MTLKKIIGQNYLVIFGEKFYDCDYSVHRIISQQNFFDGSIGNDLKIMQN